MSSLTAKNGPLYNTNEPVIVVPAAPVHPLYTPHALVRQYFGTTADGWLINLGLPALVASVGYMAYHLFSRTGGRFGLGCL